MGTSEAGPATVVADAIDAVQVAAARISDPVARASAIEDALRNVQLLQHELAQMRHRTVVDMKNAGMSYGQIAEQLGVSRSRAQQLVEGKKS